MKRVKRLSVVFGFFCIFVACCSPPDMGSEPVERESTVRLPDPSVLESSNSAIKSTLSRILRHVQPWLDHRNNWPDYSTNFLQRSWDGLVRAAKLIQASDPQDVESALQAYQQDCDDEDDKLLLLMRVVFELPEKRPFGDRVGSMWIPAFGGWMDTSGSNNRSTNAAWPISWNGGNPRLVVGFTTFSGPRYDAAAEFRFMRQIYPMRNLASYIKVDL